MKNYERPIVMINEDLAEGVYAASGASFGISSDCWTCGGAGTQESISARTDWRFQIDGKHNSEDHAANVYITFVFDTNISKAEFSGYTSQGLSTDTVVFQLTNFNGGVNGNESFGGAALVVETVIPVTSLTLKSVSISDGGAY